MQASAGAAERRFHSMALKYCTKCGNKLDEKTGECPNCGNKGKKIEDVKIVMNGAGASGLAIASLIVNLGVKKENLILCDTNGVIYKGR